MGLVYALSRHALTLCGTNLASYKTHYVLAHGEEVALRELFTRPRRKSTKKVINFRISNEHSTEATLGEFSRQPDDINPYPAPLSRSLTPENHEDSASTLCPIFPLEEEEELPSASTLMGTSHGLNQSADSDMRVEVSVAPMETTVHTENPSSSSGQASDITETRQSTGQQPSATPQVRPKPRMIAKKPQVETQVDDEPMPVAVPELPTEPHPLSTHKSARVSKPSKRRIVLSEDEEGDLCCTSPDCTMTGDLPMVACLGPACQSRVHLCCIGIKAKPNTLPEEWFCDDECRENAGGRRKRTRRG
ncbi:hypothetical protein B0H10DRAFT_1952291 [Mycena sp. CBHHK59/15]|nr:hypothetical protein B0H10DRAFT_1952291 [Mycena sp. CBHHK59/15]